MEQRRGRPRLVQALLDSLRVPDLRRRILFTILILAIARFIAHVPMPGVNEEALRELFERNELLGMLDLFSGGLLANASIAPLGVYPYITAIIIMQLLTPAIPALQRLAQEGEWGRQRITLYTYIMTAPLAMLQGYGHLVLFAREGVIELGGALSTITLLFCIAAGTMLLVWLGDRITEHGVGNGISLIIFAGIVARIPANIKRIELSIGPQGVLIIALLTALFTIFIVYFTEAYRQIPIQYSRAIYRGGRTFRQVGTSYLPLKVNSAGMIPLIFAMSVIMLPGTIAGYFAGRSGLAATIQNLFSPAGSYGGAFYWVPYFFLVVGFTFFYTMILFQQQNIPEVLQRQGGFIPGIRPGKPTADYLTRVLSRITWAGALGLGIVALMPLFTRWMIGNPAGTNPEGLMIISSAGLLIVVGVVIDTLRQLEAQLAMRQYEGFLR